MTDEEALDELHRAIVAYQADKSQFDRYHEAARCEKQAREQIGPGYWQAYYKRFPK